jgi:hypothetical protein
MLKFKDSGKRRKFKTGAQRDVGNGKGRLDLFPPRAMIAISKIYEAGCIKYGDRNWEKGIPLSRFLDSGLRHIMKWEMGEKDEPHLWQAAWNLICLIETEERIKEGLLPRELNDLPWIK